MPDFPPVEAFIDTLRLAVREDLPDGMVDSDVTSRLTISPDAVGTATVVQKAAGVACGLPVVQHVCRLVDERLRVGWIPGLHEGLVEGRHSEASGVSPVPLLKIGGPVRSMLAAERTILNLLGQLSGVATLTARYVARCAGTNAGIFDTRKTLPGLRALQKYAVRRGGGHNHRMGLHDMVLVKDNHLAAVGGSIADAAAELVRRSRGEAPARSIEMEVDTLAQFEELLSVKGVDVILLDNMDCPTMTHCVALRDRSRDQAGPGPAIEASGGVSLETVRDIAATGVDRIAVGGLTHSAAQLDIGLDYDGAD
jgi:nicotinate-nucleotide pyrophosphorylase (carboxylating)